MLSKFTIYSGERTYSGLEWWYGIWEDGEEEEGDAADISTTQISTCSKRMIYMDSLNIY